MNDSHVEIAKRPDGRDVVMDVGAFTVGDERAPAIVCPQLVELCRRIGVLKGDGVAIDGSKFKAVNNRDRNFTKGKIASRLAHLEADVERYIDEMVRIDRQEGLVGYNAQAAVDTETHLIVTHDVTNQGFDRDQPAPVATAAKTARGRDDLHAIADKGYFSGSEILDCHQAGSTTTVPRAPRPPATGARACW